MCIRQQSSLTAQVNHNVIVKTEKNRLIFNFSGKQVETNFKNKQTKRLGVIFNHT